MKKLFYILSLAAVASLTVLSCQKEKEVNPREPSPAEVANCYGVYFPAQAASGEHVYNPTQDPVIEITVARTNDSGAITVPVKATYSEDNIFVADEITFADGQKETTFKVRFDAAKEGVNYAASYVIEDTQYASLYNSNPIGLDFSILRVEMLDWVKPGTTEPAIITLNEGWWGEVHQAKMRYYEVDGVRTCTIYSAEEGNGIWGDAVDATLQFTWYTKNSNDAGYNFLEVPKQYFGFDYDGWDSVPVGEATSPIFVYDYPWYWVERGYNWGSDGMGANWLEEAKATGQIDGKYPVGYYDGNGGFYFNLRYYIPGLGGFSPDPYEFVAISEGFTRVDYSLEVKTDYSYDGISPIYIETGIDISSVKYAIYEGELTPTQAGNKADAIVAGTETATEFSEFAVNEDEGIKFATLELSPETTGVYTFVVVAYGNEAGKDPEAQSTAYASFKHIAAGDVADHAVEVSVFTEDTPARYTSYHKYDSFAYGVAGKDLTDVHVAIFKYDDVLKNVDAYFNAVKEDADGKYTMSADDLAQVNGEGGYYTIATGMPAKTNLMVVVWATNGDMDAWEYAVYTTDKLPYVWNSLGKGEYTDDVLTLYDDESDPLPPYTVTCDVYEEANTPGLYMITGYQLPLCAQVYGMTEDALAPYENSVWKNTELVIDATDPTKVFIETQEYGIRLSSSDGWMYVSSFYNGKIFATGTLADGVITFGTKNLLCGFDGSIGYYASLNGAWKLVLPTSAASSIVAPTKQNTNGSVEEKTLSAKDFRIGIPAEKVVFERDPQPVSVAVEVSYTRKDKSNSSKAFEAQALTKVR